MCVDYKTLHKWVSDRFHHWSDGTWFWKLFADYILTSYLPNIGCKSSKINHGPPNPFMSSSCSLLLSILVLPERPQPTFHFYSQYWYFLNDLNQHFTFTLNIGTFWTTSTNISLLEFRHHPSKIAANPNSIPITSLTYFFKQYLNVNINNTNKTCRCRQPHQQWIHLMMIL